MALAESLNDDNRGEVRSAKKQEVTVVCKALTLQWEEMESHQLLKFLPTARQIIHGFVKSLHLEDNMHVEMLDHAQAWLCHWENKVTSWKRFFQNMTRFSSSPNEIGSTGVLQSFKETTDGKRFTQGGSGQGGPKRYSWRRLTRCILAHSTGIRMELRF